MYGKFNRKLRVGNDTFFHTDSISHDKALIAVLDRRAKSKESEINFAKTRYYILYMRGLYFFLPFFHYG